MPTVEKNHTPCKETRQVMTMDDTMAKVRVNCDKERLLKARNRGPGRLTVKWMGDDEDSNHPYDHWLVIGDLPFIVRVYDHEKERTVTYDYVSKEG